MHGALAHGPCTRKVWMLTREPAACQASSDLTRHHVCTHVYVQRGYGLDQMPFEEHFVHACVYACWLQAVLRETSWYLAIMMVLMFAFACAFYTVFRDDDQAGFNSLPLSMLTMLVSHVHAECADA